MKEAFHLVYKGGVTINNLERTINMLKVEKAAVTNNTQKIEDFNIAINAVKKEIALLPKQEKENYGEDADGNRGIEIIMFVCPECEEELDEKGYYCKYCGQKIDRDK